MPGAGQRLKGQPQKGAVVSIAFWSLAAAFIYTQATLPPARRDYLDAATPDQARLTWRDYRNLYRLSSVTGALSAIIYLYAFSDALWSSPAPELIAIHNGQ
jgi:hypothetical protein